MYAIVADVPASWERYEALRAVLADPVPEGLVLHLAGPTDEGFRVIDVWATRADWERARVRIDEIIVAATLSAPTTRELEGLDAIDARRA